MIHQKQHGNVEYFSCSGRIIKNAARCTREIKYRIAMTKAAFSEKKTFSPAHWTSI
jgi:hypothetical protein